MEKSYKIFAPYMTLVMTSWNCLFTKISSFYRCGYCISYKAKNTVNAKSYAGY